MNSSDSILRAASLSDRSSALFRLSMTSFESFSELSATQAQIDSGITHFSEESARVSTYISLLTGSGLSRLARGGILALGANATGNTALLVQGVAGFGSVAAEAVTFETTGRMIQSVGATHASLLPTNLWNWEGEGGLAQGFYSTAINFTAFRGFGRISQGQNIVVQHAAQSTAAVLGHQLAGALDILPGPETSLAMQFLDAERGNLQLMSGLAFLHGAAPGIQAWERVQDLAAHSARRGFEGEPSASTLWIRPHEVLGVRGEGGESVPTLRPRGPGIWAMSIGDLVGWFSGSKRPPASPHEPSSAGPSEGPSCGGRDLRSPHEGPLYYFQYLYEPSEIFGLRRPEEGSVLLGRTTFKQTGLFPAYFRDISRQHLLLRGRDGRVEVRPFDGSKEVRINHVDLSPFRWTILNPGDLIEFVSEGRRDLIRPEGGAADPRYHTQRNNRPAIFRFIDPARPSTSAFERRDLPPPQGAPWNLKELLAEMDQFSQAVDNVAHLTAQMLRQYGPDIFQDAEGTARDLVNVHRPLCGEAARTDLFELPLEWKDPSQPVVLRLPFRHGNLYRLRVHEVPPEEGRESDLFFFPVPHWPEVLAERLRVFEEGFSSFEDFDPAGPFLRSARQKLTFTRDQLVRLHETVKIYRQSLVTPLSMILLDRVEEAYGGILPEAAPRVERVRSETRTLELKINEEERELWMNQFFEGVSEPRVRRNSQILMGRVPTLFGEPIGGSFHQALALGTPSEGERSVRGLYDRKTGELVAFRDESAQFLQTVGRLRRMGRTLEDVSLFVDALGRGTITRVTVYPADMRESVREGFEGMVGLQVLPVMQTRVQRNPLGASLTLFGTTERDIETGEVWEMTEAGTTEFGRTELRQVVAVTPYYESVGPDGVPRWGMATMEGLPGVEGAGALQLWMPYERVRDLAEGTIVRVTRRR